MSWLTDLSPGPLNRGAALLPKPMAEPKEPISPALPTRKDSSPHEWRLKRQNTVLYSLTTELEAVRDVLCEHGLAYKALLMQKRAHYVEELKATVADDFSKFEQILQQLREPKQP